MSRVFLLNECPPHWPPGTTAAARAVNEKYARRLIETDLRERGLVKDEREGPLKLFEISLNEAKAYIFQGGTWGKL